MFGDPVTNTNDREIRPFSDFMTNIRYGTSQPPAFSEDGQYKFIRATNIKGGRITETDMLRINQEAADKIQKCKLDGNEIIIVRSGANTGDTCVVTEGYRDQYAGYDIIVSLDLSKANPVFFNELMNTHYMQSVIKPLTVRSAQPHLNTKQVQNLPMLIATLDEQNLFADFVQQSDKSKFVRFKSQFIEMFGELGKDDKGWGITTLGECCELNPKRPRVIDDELLVSFVPMPAVSEDGKIDCSDIKPYKEVRKGFTYFAENDVLFAKITPCMENGKGAVAKGLEGGIGFGSTEFHVLRPIAGKSNPYWLYILTMFESFRVGARKVMTGTGGQLRVPIGYLNDYSITLPPIDLQDRFEEFVHQSDKSK